MIVEYNRPANIEEALRLLARPEPLTVPLAGGSALNRPLSGPAARPVAVVDLQGLGLDRFQKRGNFLDIGAAVTLQALLEAGETYPALEKAIRHEASYNLRQVATAAGTLVSADGRSPFTTALLALDAGLALQPGDESISLGDLLPLRTENLRGKLITQVTIPLNARLAYDYVARTPADLPLVCAAVALWPSGRARVALGGYGAAPLLAFDAPEANGVEIAARSAYSQAGDEWASAEYRQDVAGTLAQRCLELIK